MVRLAGVDPHAAREEISEDELREMISDQRDISPEQRTILSGAFEIGDRMLRHVLVPRREMDTVLSEASAEQALQILAERPAGSYVTVAGLVLLLLGHIPSGPGTSVTVGGWTFTVTEADGRVVSEVLPCPT